MRRRIKVTSELWKHSKSLIRDSKFKTQRMIRNNFRRYNRLSFMDKMENIVPDFYLIQMQNRISKLNKHKIKRTFNKL